MFFSASFFRSARILGFLGGDCVYVRVCLWQWAPNFEFIDSWRKSVSACVCENMGWKRM